MSVPIALKESLRTAIEELIIACQCYLNLIPEKIESIFSNDRKILEYEKQIILLGSRPPKEQTELFLLYCAERGRLKTEIIMLEIANKGNALAIQLIKGEVRKLNDDIDKKLRDLGEHYDDIRAMLPSRSELQNVLDSEKFHNWGLAKNHSGTKEGTTGNIIVQFPGGFVNRNLLNSSTTAPTIESSSPDNIEPIAKKP